MPQPTFAGWPRICLFGGRSLPNGQGTMVNVNLNDFTSWFLQAGYEMEVIQQLQVGQQAYLAQGVRLSTDFGPTPLHLPVEYRESVVPIGAQLATLLMAGEQNLTFDNLTAIRASFISAANRSISFIAPSRPLRWTMDLQFLAVSPWFTDIATSTLAPVTLASGSATTFSIGYAGSIFTRPTWTLTIPVSNAAPIASFSIGNVMSGETLTVVFPGNLPASTAATVTINASAMTVTDANGVSYDVGGNAFPNLYGPAGQMQQISATLTPASGTATGCTIAASYQNRWLL